MSNLVLNEAWKLALKSSQKLVLISLADQADDDGWCFPSIQSLMNRTGLSERAVQMQLNELEAMGAITRHRRRHATTVYRVTPEAASCERIRKVERTDNPLDTIGGGPARASKSRPAKSAGLENPPTETRTTCTPDPQILRSDPAPGAPKPSVTITGTPISRASAREGWGGFARAYPKKGKAREARALWDALGPEDQALALAVVRRQLGTPAWQGEQVRWLPTMAKFLGERLFDLYPEPTGAAPVVVPPPERLTDDQRRAGQEAARAARAALLKPRAGMPGVAHA